MSAYPEGVEIRRSAEISECGQYRYRLLRRWGRGSILPFVMLNPSTADGTKDDPTIVRCVGFARSFGYDGIGVWNLYAYRATKPPEVWRAAKGGTDVIGPDNDRRLRNLIVWAVAMDVPVVAAWGANAKPGRAADVIAMPRGRDVFHHLGVTAAGIPRHPLMLRADTPLTRWAA